MTTVRQFIRDVYNLITAQNPSVPLHGSDQSDALRYLNRLLKHYALSGLNLTIAREVNVPVGINQQNITFGSPSYIPTPDVTEGRLITMENAWLILEGVTYPLNIYNRNDFHAAYKYKPLKGLPRYAVLYPETDLTRVRIFPAPSQSYEFYCRGKFQLEAFTLNDDMSILPENYFRFFTFAVAKDVAYFKARADAWTEKLEDEYKSALKDIQSVTSLNLKIDQDEGDFLNGSWRVRAGI
jgi:hypothetical protein